MKWSYKAVIITTPRHHTIINDNTKTNAKKQKTRNIKINSYLKSYLT